CTRANFTFRLFIALAFLLSLTRASAGKSVRFSKARARSSPRPGSSAAATKSGEAGVGAWVAAGGLAGVRLLPDIINYCFCTMFRAIAGRRRPPDSRPEAGATVICPSEPVPAHREPDQRYRRK